MKNASSCSTVAPRKKGTETETEKKDEGDEGDNGGCASMEAGDTLEEEEEGR